MSALPIDLKSSSARWVAPPAPADAPFSLPGRAWASASSSPTFLAGRSGRTTSSIGLMPTGATAAKSRRTSNGMLGVSAGATVVEPLDASMKTLPSAGALATELAAISPLAPARFSTTTLRPRRWAMPGAIRRVSRSLGPPGGKPTTKRSGLSGKSVVAWARAIAGSAKGVAEIPHRRRRRERVLMRRSMLPLMTFAQTPHGDLYYEAIDHTAPWQARGLPVLFHHGIGSSSALWRGWTPALVDRHPLIAFDMRGCGRSSVPPADFPWSLDAMVDDLFS